MTWLCIGYIKGDMHRFVPLNNIIQLHASHVQLPECLQWASLPIGMIVNLPSLLFLCTHLMCASVLDDQLHLS